MLMSRSVTVVLLGFLTNVTATSGQASAGTFTSLFGEAVRLLEDAEEDVGDDYNYDEVEEDTVTTIKYDSCYRDGNGNDIVFFKICPSESSCNNECEGGKGYLTNLTLFVSTFIPNSDAVYGEGGCDGDDDDDCNNDDDNNNNGAALDRSAFVSCTTYDEKFFVGPYCWNQRIHVGYYWDDACTQLMDDQFFFALYGKELDYSSTSGSSMVNTTIPCEICEDAEQDNGQDDYGFSNTCGDLVEQSFPWWGDKIDDDEESSTKGMIGARTSVIALLVAMLVIVGYTVYKISDVPSSSWWSKKKSLLTPDQESS